jgi:methylglutaconyl-CoA hydratase/polyketide biosynthesis enoyl-CoA hydratase PksH
MGLVDELAENEMGVALERQLQRLFHSSPRAIAETKKYLESLNQKNLQVQIDMAFSEITSWLKVPENVDDIVSFSSGRPASWFQKYRGKVNV